MTFSKRTRAAAAVFGVFTLIALAFASSNYAVYAVRGLPVDWWNTFGYSATEWYLWALMCPLIFWVARRFPLTTRGWPRHLPMHAVAWAGSHLVIVAAYIVMERLAGTPEMRAMALSQLVLLYVTKKIAFNLLVYAGIVGVAHAIDLYQRYRERERRALQLETQLTRAQLEALKNQLHPHFLFNTLNTISALLHRDVESADRVVSRLGDLLRLSLQGGEQEVTLGQELAFLQHYLDIQYTRFQDRLTFSQEVAPETLDALVPSLILQPLVENAIRHGIEPRSAPGRIEITAKREDGRLTLEVRDNGPGLQDSSPGKQPGCAGIGLSNTRARLEQLYGVNHRFTLENHPAGGLVVHLEVPFRRAAAEGSVSDG